jgi:hypothetical protein
MNLNEAYIRIGFFSDQMKCICIFYTTMGVRHVKCTPKSNHACAGEFLLAGWRRPAGDGGDRSFSAKKKVASIGQVPACICVYTTVYIYVGAPVAAQLISGRAVPVSSPAASYVRR